MKEHYLKMLAYSDIRVEKALARQVMDKNHKYFGGFKDEYDLIEAKKAIYHTTTMTACFCNSGSRFFQNAELAKRIFLALDYIEKVQHENGLFDFINCNFYSAPDTAFCIKRALPTYIYLKNHLAEFKKGSTEVQIFERLGKIIKKGAAGLVSGGFHTPNHRWAIASVLYQCAELFEKPEYKACADKYLNEGIDCNSDGEYAEKSSGNYNRINNDAMITLGDLTGDKTYYEHAIRNLRMMLTYFEPNGSIFTANSTRQDNGVLIYPRDYYTEYLRMGHDFNIPEFLSMANTIFDLIEENNLNPPDFLMHLMNRPDLIEVEHEGHYKQENFCKFYKESGISRAHTEVNTDDAGFASATASAGSAGGISDTYSITWTLLRGKSNFLYFAGKSLVLEMKVAGSFCEHRAFVPEEMEQLGGSRAFKLSQTMHGWYYLPFDEKPATNDWWKMDNASRKKLHGPDLGITAEVKEVCDKDGIGLDVHIKAASANASQPIEAAPFRIEIACAGAQTVCGEDFELPCKAGEGLLGKQGMISFKNANECISVGPAFAEHRYTAGKFGSEAASASSFTLYFTDFVPFERVIKIRKS